MLVLAYTFLICFVTNWEAHVEHCCCAPRCDDWLAESHSRKCLHCELTYLRFFHGILFLLERATVDKLQLFRCGYQAILKVSEMNLFKKNVTWFVAKNKFCAFEQTLEFWKSYVYNHKFETFQYLETFHDENSDDINKCRF